jgi:hypothetical protein
MAMAMKLASAWRRLHGWTSLDPTSLEIPLANGGNMPGMIRVISGIKQLSMVNNYHC